MRTETEIEHAKAILTRARDNAEAAGHVHRDQLAMYVDLLAWVLGQRNSFEGHFLKLAARLDAAETN